MARYSYRIEANYGTSDDENWGIYAPDLSGADDFDGTADDYARTILNNWLDDQPSDHEMPWRVLVWKGGQDREIQGTESDADAIAERDENKPSANQGGRPTVGNVVNIAMGNVLPRVDEYAFLNQMSRAAAIRDLVTFGLRTWENSTQTLVWSLVNSDNNRGANAVEPLNIPDEVSEWLEDLQEYDPDDDTQYLLVAPSDEVGPLEGELAYVYVDATAQEVDQVRKDLAEQRQARSEMGSR